MPFEYDVQKRIPDVIFADRTGNVLHPTEKPVNLLEQIISANKGDLILDCFAGGGSTLLACKNSKRRFIGIEIEPKYCKIAEQRLRQQILF